VVGNFVTDIARFSGERSRNANHQERMQRNGGGGREKGLQLRLGLKVLRPDKKKCVLFFQKSGEGEAFYFIFYFSKITIHILGAPECCNMCLCCNILGHLRWLTVLILLEGGKIK
jgi:hypothetical protein